MSLLNQAVNNNTAVNTCLVDVFIVLSARSLAQEQTIKVLEEKDSLLKSNKGMKNAMWPCGNRSMRSTRRLKLILKKL
ncbi:hypothetical protein ACS0TY_023051 [Phlomoides rotata]